MAPFPLDQLILSSPRRALCGTVGVPTEMDHGQLGRVACFSGFAWANGAVAFVVAALLLLRNMAKTGQSLDSAALFFIIFGGLLLIGCLLAPRIKRWCKKCMEEQDRMIEAERRKDRLARIHPDEGGLEKGDGMKKANAKGDGAKQQGVEMGWNDKAAAGAEQQQQQQQQQQQGEQDDSKNALIVGDPVQACRASVTSHGQELFDQGSSYPATVSRVNGDGTFAITYVGGETHPAVPRSFIAKASEAYTFS